MRALASGGLVAACVYVGFTHPFIALPALIIFAGFGATYELIRTKK